LDEISIPYGAIKRFRVVKDNQVGGFISIPYGAIKSVVPLPATNS